MRKLKEKNTEDTDEIVCPHCFYVFEESWGFNDDADVDCYRCGDNFKLKTSYVTTYTTY
jgi:DNA-directed RNA polymerase subunit RPC12/RpoP